MRGGEDRDEGDLRVPGQDPEELRREVGRGAAGHGRGFGGA